MWPAPPAPARSNALSALPTGIGFACKAGWAWRRKSVGGDPSDFLHDPIYLATQHKLL